MLANQFRSTQYSQNFPLKLSTNALCVGLPSQMKCSRTPIRFAHRSKFRAILHRACLKLQGYGHRRRDFSTELPRFKSPLPDQDFLLTF